MRFRGLTGFRDFYPEEMAARRWIEQAWHRASRAAGFQEVDGPLLESLELITAKSGDEIVGQLYAFEDKGGREVAMRPEMTPSLARMVGARAGGLPKPIKWYSVPQFFRYERPQRGRGREFIQWNADVIGSPDPVADAEVIALGVRGLELLGLGPADISVRISDRRVAHRLLASLDLRPQDEGPVLAWIDKIDRDEAARRRLAELLGEARAAQIATWCESFPTGDAPELERVMAALEDFGLGPYLLPDFAIVRGLDYYTGCVWEYFDRGRKLRSIGGGGRYDELIAGLGGPRLEAVGFGLGDMTLSELLRERGLLPEAVPRVEVYVIPIGDEMEGPARKVLRELRQHEIPADAPYRAARVARALKTADSLGARRAVLVGPDEWGDGCVRVKDLATGEERVVPLEELE